MKKLPLLVRAFDEMTPEEFMIHSKSLSKVWKPKVKTRKKKADADTSGSKPSVKRSRKTKTNVGVVETT